MSICYFCADKTHYLRMMVAKELKKSFERYVMALADLLLPRKCVVCGRHLLVDEAYLCAHCLSGLPLTYSWMQGHNSFADRMNERIESWRMEEDGEERYAFVAVMYFYSTSNGFNNITRQVKYHGNIGLGKWLGRKMGGYLKAAGHFSTADMVVPVPLHWSRKLSRGYNQAGIIARAMAEEMGLPCADVLVRRRRTRTQTRMNLEDKQRNVRGAFKMRRTMGKLKRAEHILLVDDVFTTGATCFECFKALRRQFGPAIRISVVCIGGV